MSDGTSAGRAGLWEAEYLHSGIPSSVREAPSNVVVRFMEERPADCGVPERARAVDIGCGTGRNSIYLAEKGFEVRAMDFASSQVEAFRARLAGRPDLNVVPIEHDVTKPWPILSGWADVAVDTFCFKHQIEADAIACYVSEVRRVLRPGGRFLLFLAGKADGYYRRFATRDLSGPGMVIHDPGNGIPSRLYDQAEVRAVFRDFSLYGFYAKASRNEMHGTVYDRQSLVFHFVRPQD